MRFQGWLALPVTLQALIALPIATSQEEPTLDEIARLHTKRTSGGVHLPIVRRERKKTLEARGVASAIGLGDYIDVVYTVLLTVGGITTPLVLDTGSSDLWVISDTCTQGCSGDARPYTQATFQSAGIGVTMLYGDSSTGTFARGLVGLDKVDLAGINLKDQSFSAINQTNTTVVDIGAAGIFGVGFPINSVVWNDLFIQKYGVKSTSKREVGDGTAATRPDIKYGSPFPSFDLRRYTFPSVSDLLNPHSPHSTSHETRQTTPNSGLVPTALASWGTIGPFIPRLVTDGVLTQPMISITLQRNTIDVGGNVGLMSLGELPTGVKADQLTWVPLRGYTAAQGGIPAPPDSPKEVYPLTWEVMIDDIYLDGEKLPRSTLSSSSIGLSALIDTGNSLLRGPSDVVDFINDKLGPKGYFPCSQPHTLAFQMGGKMFPVDPRDFAAQAFKDNAQSCSANLVATDAPRTGGYQFSWSLGAPFLKGVLASFYFGNLTYPSQDQPRIGFLSTVPGNAGDLMTDAVTAALRANGNFPGISQAAPTGTVKPAQTDSHGVPQATTKKSSAMPNYLYPGQSWSLSTAVFANFGLLIAMWNIEVW